jgi:hypothetical protein
MSATKRKGDGQAPDLSHQPTRKVDSMSSLVAEMLLRDPDADATSPGLPAVNESDAHDAVGLDMARLIEVRSSVAPGAPTASRDADESAAIRAMRSSRSRVGGVLVVLVVVAGFLAAALALWRG